MTEDKIGRGPDIAESGVPDEEAKNRADIRRGRRIFTRLGIAYGVFLLLGTGLQLMVGVAYGLAHQFIPGFSMDQNLYLFLAMLPIYIVSTPICYLILKDMPSPLKPEKKSLSMKQLFIYFTICIAVMYIGNIIGTLLMGITSVLRGREFLNPVSTMVGSMETWTIFVTMVVLAPLTEEFLCRKLLIDRVRQYGDRTAVLISGLIFGLMHGNFYQFFYAFGLGVIFAYIYINTGKLWYTIGFHAVINFMGSILALWVLKERTVTAIYGLILLVTVIMGVIFLIRSRKKIVLKPGLETLPKKGRFAAVFLNPGMILFFLTSCGMFIINQLG